MKILANDGISVEGKNALENAGYTVLTEKVEQNQLSEAINQQSIEILLVRSATTARKELIDACPNLKLIGRGGVGMDNIDVEYAKSKGIHVINTPASSSQSVAELVMGQLFSISRFLFDASKNMPTLGNEKFAEFKKKYAKGVELRGKTLGIIGFGRIGQSLASYALGIGMKVMAFDIHEYTVNVSINIAGHGAINIPITTSTKMFEQLAECDYISIHIPKQANGDAVIDAKTFPLLKKGVRIVNAARGGVIDENALIDAIDKAWVSYAAIDVFENEPKPLAKLLSHEKIATTPHIGAATEEAQDRIGLELAELIVSTFGKK
jgi:D-3-phosphoglycerate dehydrogenase